MRATFLRRVVPNSSIGWVATVCWVIAVCFFVAWLVTSSLILSVVFWGFLVAATFLFSADRRRREPR
jgi:hypothetical protein